MRGLPQCACAFPHASGRFVSARAGACELAARACLGHRRAPAVGLHRRAFCAFFPQPQLLRRRHGVVADLPPGLRGRCVCPPRAARRARGCCAIACARCPRQWPLRERTCRRLRVRSTDMPSPSTRARGSASLTRFVVRVVFRAPLPMELHAGRASSTCAVLIRFLHARGSVADVHRPPARC